MAKAFEGLASLFDQWSEGVQVADDEMRYRYLNPAAAAHGKSTAEQLVGRTMAECYPGIERTEMYRLIELVRDTGKEDSLENAFTFPDGTDGWFELRMYRIPDAVVIVSKDITAQRNLELHARHGQRMEAAAKLAGGLAHGFNNALTVITTLAELSLVEHDLADRHREDLERILQATDRTASLTRKLLALARQFPGGKAQSIDVRTFLQRLLPALQEAVGEGTTVRVEVAEDVGAIRMDPNALEQLLAQLVTNASAAMPHGGEVRIEASRAPSGATLHRPGAPRLPSGDHVSLRVIDAGVGIPAEVIEQIFDPFFTTGIAGTAGLGLAMCWGLVEQAGGTIRVESQKGRGTKMEVLLLRHEPAPDSPKIIQPPVGTRTHGARILVVDDEEIILSVVSRSLERLGYAVLSVPGGGEALDEINSGTHIDLVLTDLAMPEMSEIELIDALGKRGVRIPVVVMTGYSPDHHALRDIPTDRLVTKPFTQAQLRAAVETALREAPVTV